MRTLVFGIVLTSAVTSAVPVFAESNSTKDLTSSISSLTQGLDTEWVFLGAFLVFFMQAGFGM